MYQSDDIRLVSGVDTGLSNFFKQIYLWMAMGIGITGLSAWYISNSPALLKMLYSNRIVFYVLIFAQLGLVFFLSARVLQMSFSSALLWFSLYSLLTGVTMSYIFLLYTGESIAIVFFITAGTFAAMSIYGFTTGQDLSRFRNILLMGLFGVIIASVVNIFLKSSILYWAVSIIGVVVFVGLIAYDTQKLKNYYYQFNDEAVTKNVSVLGALTLYLDFINLFLMLLRIFGRRK